MPAEAPGPSPLSVRCRRGRADALRAYFAFGPEAVAGPARRLGFEWPRPREDDLRTPRREKGGSAPPTEVPSRPRAEAVDLDPIPFWRAVAVEPREELAAEAAIFRDPEVREAPRPGDFRSSGAVPDGPPIVAERRLRRRLDDALRGTRSGRDLDVDELVRRVARGDSLARLPYRTSLARPRLAVLLDSASRLDAFRLDVVDFLTRLVRRMDAAAIRLLPAPASRRSVRAVARAAAGNDVVLAVSDLGFYGGRADRELWRRLGNALRVEGVALRALVPCPAWRWRGELAAMWGAIDWSQPEGAGRRRPPVPLPGLGGVEPVELLMALVAPAVRVEPGLLRAVRRLLGPAADLGIEAAAWRHPAVDGRSTQNLEIDLSYRKALIAGPLRRLFDRAKHDDDARQLVCEAMTTIVAWHRPLPDLVWANDVAQWLASGADEAMLGGAMFGDELVEEAVRILARLAAAADERRFDYRELQATLAFQRRLIVRAPEGFSRDKRFGAILERFVKVVRAHHPDAELPAGTTAAMLEDDAAPRRLHVRQHGDRLTVAPAANEGVGSWLADLLGTKTVALDDGRRSTRELAIRGSEPVAADAPPTVTDLALISGHEVVRAERWSMPSWASAAGRDGYGLWAAFEVDGVEQRLRWIPPGRLLMGSPEAEEGRDDDEVQHEVVLTEGYWLAEVPVTQALWTAVMGDNPSRFVSPERPVEQVSWDDCHRFLDRLNFRFRDLELTLPSEAEWERACRAATDAATWLGDLAIRGRNNAPILNDIAWYGGNSGVGYELDEWEDSSGWSEKQHDHERAGTRLVRTKAPNPWGLYDILGNVWEWCSDWFGDYPTERQVDPEGPSGGSYRVIRGGSWGDLARDVRAAYRFGHVPGYRRGALGFRLSRGPLEGGAQNEAEPRGGSEAAERGTSRRARSRRATAGGAPAGRAHSRRSTSWVARLGWAVDGGLDRYGRWAAIEVKKVRHRLRWIYPGRFWMGSSDSEAGRYDDEGPRHEVTLTEGFWLGETPCTQDLWQAVMGTNPSEFKTPDRPVERVSWEDCQAFFERLASLVEGFAGRLPTEAQWEYACRAGTEAATWAGDLEILGERNAPVLDPIAWYGGNSGRGFDLGDGRDVSDWEERQFPEDRVAGTRAVGQKRPNPWGLYDMLGNVWEWCADSWDLVTGYPGGSRIDPVSTDGSFRVFRGGSWGARARDVRAACRDGYDPGLRSGDLGFRLSRGPNQEWAEPRSEARPGAGGAGRGQAKGWLDRILRKGE